MTSVEFLPGGKKVLTAALDGTARLWDIDLLPIAQAHRPRELTDEERARYHVDKAGK